MSADGQEAAVLLLLARIAEFREHMRNHHGQFSQAWKQQALDKWQRVQDAYQYVQNGGVP